MLLFEEEIIIGNISHDLGANLFIMKGGEDDLKYF